MLRTLVALAALLTLLSPAARATGNAGLAASLQTDVARFVAARAAIEHFSAVSVSVSLHGAPAPIDVVSGTTSFGGDVPASPQSLFQIGSQTQAFTAVVVLQLEAEGKLRLDQTLGDVLPQYKVWSNVTIHSLLNMTAGIADYRDNTRFLAGVAADPNRVWTAPELIAFAEPDSPGAPAPPTTQWHFSDTGYLLAQLIVERVTGNTLQAEIERRLLGPRYGLTDTFYSADRYPAAVTDRMLSGYFFNRSPGNEPLAPLLGRDVKDASVSAYQGAGGMVSRPDDMTRWVRALYQSDMLAPAQRRELMQLVSLRTGKDLARPTRTDPTPYGMAVAAFRWPLAGLGWNYMGETLGYRTFYCWFPRSDTVIAISINSQPSAADVYALRGLFEALILTLRKAGKL